MYSSAVNMKLESAETETSDGLLFLQPEYSEADNPSKKIIFFMSAISFQGKNSKQL